MSKIIKLFGALLGDKQNASEAPERHRDIKQGRFWDKPDALSLAAGRGYNQSVVGESFYREKLKNLTGGQTTSGVNVSTPVELREEVYEGTPAIYVLVEGQRCGSIPRGDVEALLLEIRALAQPGKPLLAKGRITAGFEGGDYSVSISVARPLKLLR